MLPKKTCRKPLYNQILFTRKNVVNNSKIFNLKKKKWSKFKFFARLNLKFFKRYRFNDPAKLYVVKFASSGNSFKKEFKNYLMESKKLKLALGGLKKTAFKKTLKEASKSTREAKNSLRNSNLKTLYHLEQRLDSLLCRTYFCKTIQQSKQMIRHGHIKLNGLKVTANTSLTTYGDVISVTSCPEIRKIIKTNIMNSSFWPLPPEFLRVNYKTLKILNLVSSKTVKTGALFRATNLNIAKVNNLARFK